jgi:hypothetical protein
VTPLLATAPHDLERLLAEIQRYLHAVDAFRGEGCEIHWTLRPAEAPGAYERSGRR